MEAPHPLPLANVRILAIEQMQAMPYATQLLAHLGADVVKTAFPTGASADDFRAIVDSCFVPVVVLGGIFINCLR